MTTDSIHLEWRALERLIREHGPEGRSCDFLVTSRNVIVSDSVLLHSIKKARKTDYPLMMIGPWGTGKNVVLELIHRGSIRKDSPFRDENLVGSQDEIDDKLFGIKDAPGVIERNDGATIHLDFMENLLDKAPLADKLIHLVEGGELKRKDGTIARVDVRIIGGANIDLAQALSPASEDVEPTDASNLLLNLYERLSAKQIIRMRQIREMPERLPQLLTEQLVMLHVNQQAHDKALDKVSEIPRNIMMRLQRHTWNRNFFELARVVSKVVDSGTWDVALSELDQKPRPKVFISYSFVDEDSATQIYQRLEPLFDVSKAKEGFPLPGQEWKRIIIDAIGQSDFVLVCLSNSSLKKGGFFHVEIREAIKKQMERPLGRVYIIPLVLEHSAEALIPTEFQTLHWAQLYIDWESKLRDVIRIISEEYQRFAGFVA